MTAHDEVILRRSESYRSTVYYQINNFLGRFSLYAVLILGAVLLMTPILWMFLSSLKTTAEYISFPPTLLPKVPQWSNYYDVIYKYKFLKYALNTIYLAVLFTVTNVLSSAFAGYGFARLKAPGRNVLFLIMLSAIMVPNIITIIPQFVIYSRMKIVGTFWPWFLWGIAGNAFNIFLFRQFFANFPVELEDAAAVDGCSPLRTFWQIFLPNAKPVIAVTAIGAFNWVWGDFFNQTLLLSERSATLAMKLAGAFVDPRGNPLTTITLAANVIYIIPLIVIYFVGQKQIIQGIVTTGGR